MAARSSPPFPSLRLTLEVGQQRWYSDALIDTGFDGDIVVPAWLIQGTAPMELGHRWTLADGSVVYAPTYEGVATIDNVGSLTVIVTALGDEVLVGLGVVRHYRIILDHGQRVIVEP